jgi:hypothetical protein
MKICFVFASRKGGVGKSFLAVSLLDFLRYENGVRTIAIDADYRNMVLANRYGLKDESGNLLPPERQEIWTGVPYLTAPTADQGKAILMALQHDANYVLVDLAGGADKDLRDMFPNESVMRKIFEKSGYRLVVVLPFDEQAESSPAAREIVELFGRTTQYLVVGNPKSDNARKDPAMTARYAEIKKLLPNGVLFALGATMHSEGANCYAANENASLAECGEIAEAADPIAGMITSGWIDEYRSRQGEIWRAAIESLSKKPDA